MTIRKLGFIDYKDGLRTCDDTLAAFAKAQKRARRPLLWSLWAIAALLAAGLLLD